MEIIPDTGPDVYQHEGTALNGFSAIKEWADETAE